MSDEPPVPADWVALCRMGHLDKRNHHPSIIQGVFATLALASDMFSHTHRWHLHGVE